MSATQNQRLVALKHVCEHAIALADGGKQKEAETLLRDFADDPDNPYPPHATACGTCHAKAKIPAHSGSATGLACLNCGHPT